MPSPPSRRLSTTPHFPGAWPSPLRDLDDDQDADISSLSSHGSCSAVRAEKTRRRWTYTGPPRSHGYSSSPSLRCSGSTGGSASNEDKMSPLTEHTVSTALSSPLNTPDLADWPTRLGGSQSLLLDNFVSPSSSPHPVTRYSKTSSPRRGANPPTYRPRFASGASTTHHFPSPHLDPPLLNFIPGLPPLKLPLPDISVEFPYQELSSPTPSRRAHEHHPATPASARGRRGSDYPSPSMPTSSQSSVSMTSGTDSPVLPPSNGTQALEGESAEPRPLHSHAHVSEMDAFALATAVAASHSRSSFSIPPSVQSAGAVASFGTSEVAVELPQTPAYKRPSPAPEVSASRGKRIAPSLRGDSFGQSSGVCLSPKHPEWTRTRRVSAPQPSVWRSPRPQPVRTMTISSRVDVGEDGRKHRLLKPPVFGKMRKIGERLRGLFKSKGDSASRGVPALDRSPEYGLMTTTTAITNVEYESEHPIPLPSPRAKIMRNHRRSLPLPLLLSSSVDRLQPTTLSRPPLETDPVPTLAQTVTDERVEEQRASPAHGLEDPCRSPRTPKARRERTQTAPHTVEAERKPIKSRRFSLSSALSKSKMESMRSTVVPRPPLPAMQSKLSVATNSSRHPSAPGSAASGALGGEDQERDSLWGGELSTIPDASFGPVIRVVNDDSPARTRTHTAPSPSAQSQQHSDDAPTAKHKRSRRFSLSSMMARRSSRAAPQSAGQHLHPGIHSQSSRRRPRGDTVTTITHGSVQFDMIYPRARFDIGPWPVVPETLPSHRSSLVSRSSGAESTYYDAPEIPSDDDDNHRFASERACSPRPESDLDSMSFARTPDYSSVTFSIGSSTEREYFMETSDPSASGSYIFRPDTLERHAGPSAVTQLVGGSSSTPITKTLRFSPSLTLSFDMSCSDGGDDDELRRQEEEEELSFMRSLGFEFDEIARRVREESL